MESIGVLAGCHYPVENLDGLPRGDSLDITTDYQTEDNRWTRGRYQNILGLKWSKSELSGIWYFRRILQKETRKEAGIKGTRKRTRVWFIGRYILGMVRDRHLEWYSIHCFIPCTRFRSELDLEKYIFNWIVLELQEQLAKRHVNKTSIFILNRMLCCSGPREIF